MLSQPAQVMAFSKIELLVLIIATVLIVIGSIIQWDVARTTDV